MIKSTKSQKKTFAGVLYEDNRKLLQLLTVVFMIAVIVVIPLYTKLSYGQIGTDKRELWITFLETYWKITLPFLALQAILWIMGKQHSKKNAPGHLLDMLRGVLITDWFVLGYLAAVLVSYLASDYRQMAMLGSSGWSMGALTQLSLVGAYFLISRFWNKKAWVPGLILPVSGFLFVLGYLNRFNLWPIPMENNWDPQFISLSGNINWYCGYLVTVLFGAVYLAWCGALTKIWQKVLLDIYMFAGFCALVTNGSSSGILTLLGILFVLLLLSVSDVCKLMRYCETVLLLGMACLFTLILRLLFPQSFNYQETSNNLFTYSPLPFVIVLSALSMLLWCRQMHRKKAYPARCFRLFGHCLLLAFSFLTVLFIVLLTVNTRFPGSIGKLSQLGIFTFSPAWGSTRGATWMTGALAWRELPLFRKLMGVGPDCMVYYLYNDASADLLHFVQTIWPYSTLSNAHCEWLTILVNLGLVGFVSFGGLMISSISLFMKKGAAPKHPLHLVAGACGMSILAYSIHNLFSFQQILNTPVMFLLLGVGAACCKAEQTS